MTKWEKALRIGVVQLAALGWLSQPLVAQSEEDHSDLKREIEALKEGQNQIRQELREIKELLQAAKRKQPEPFKGAVLKLEGSGSVGEETAKVTLVEFTDYQCPFCGRHARSVLPRILKDYVETGKVRYVVREFPLKAIHPAAEKASEAALCAADQGKYWEMHDRLFANQKALSVKDLLDHGKALQLDPETYQQCLESGKYTKRVEGDVAEGTKAGVQGTPSFFLGLSDSRDATEFKATQYLHGAQPYQRFKQVIDGLLASESDGKPAVLQ